MKEVLLLLFLFGDVICFGQKQSNVWCFGDSAGIDFNASVPIPIGSYLDTRGSCSSISDSTGQLLFYSSYDADVYTSGGPPFNGGEIFTKQHQTMQNGDSIVMGLWYHEVVIINNPSNTNQYYVFSIGVTGNYGLYYAKVDMNQNGGLGQVLVKNVQLQNFEEVDCLSAVKHGNGRDWWIISRKFDQLGGNNSFYSYLISPSGISNVAIQNVGSINGTNLGKLSFSPAGDKILFTNYGDLIELYDFDRCTGVINNPRTINQQGTSLFYNTWGSEFSPWGNLIYISTSDTVSYLYQYNLNDSNPQATRDTIWSTNYPQYTGGDLKRGPDGKIYFSCAYDNQIIFNYPYPDSMYNMYNMNLSVINSPDSLGAACNFTPYSFYLGGKRTYWGLPNNPDYDMPRDSGSVCDTIEWTGINEQEASGKGQLYVSYIIDWQKLFVNAQNIKGKNAVLKIYDLNGRVVFSSAKKTQPPYFTHDVDISKLSYGIYVVSLITEKEVLVKKFVKK